jgi:hypothetical protein
MGEGREAAVRCGRAVLPPPGNAIKDHLLPATEVQRVIQPVMVQLSTAIVLVSIIALLYEHAHLCHVAAAE